MEEWHLDKKVTVGIISVLLLNSFSSIWWASRMDYTVQTHSQRIKDHDEKLENMQLQDYKLMERLARIEENQKHSAKLLGRIERAVK